VKALLQKLKDDVEQAEAALAKAQSLQQKVREAEADLGRVREDLTAVGKGGAKSQAEKLGERLLSLEDELKKLREAEKTERARAEKLRLTLVAAR